MELNVYVDFNLLGTMTGHTNYVLSVSFNPNTNVLASGSSDNTIKLWNPITGVLLRTMTGYTSSVYSVSFNPNTNVLASGSWDNRIKLWNPITGELLLKRSYLLNRFEKNLFIRVNLIICMAAENRLLTVSREQLTSCWLEKYPL